MVMSSCVNGDVRDRLPALWRAIEHAHFTYLETDDSPEKIRQRNKLQGYIMQYLSLVPHECKFGLCETGTVFQRTVTELGEFSAYRAGLGWAALERYAANLLAQPWRTEYKTIRLYSGYFKHEVEANIVGAETLLHAMGYKPIGHGKLMLDGPVCPDMVAAMSRDALIAQCECQMMCEIWEGVWSSGARVSWSGVFRHRQNTPGDVASAVSALTADLYNEQEIYTNVPTTATSGADVYDGIHAPTAPCTVYHETCLDEPIVPMMHPYMVPATTIPSVMYPHEVSVPMPQVPMVPYGVPYYYPVQTPYMIPTPVYPPIKHASNIPVNGYSNPYRHPIVPTAQLIELDSSSVYENGKYEDERCRKRMESSRRNSTSKSGFSEVSLPSIPRSDTQPALSKAKEDGMGTYESWDYVFRNLSSKEQNGDRSRYSPSERDSRTLERLDKEERRAKYQPTTLDLEDGLSALHIDRSYDEEMYRTAKVNENLMKLKQEQELKRAKHLAKKAEKLKKERPVEYVGNPPSDALINSKVAPDKMRLLTKKDVKDRKEVLKAQSLNSGDMADLRRVKKNVISNDGERPGRSKPMENGISSHGSKHSSGSSHSHISTSSVDLKSQLVVSLDEPDSRVSPPRHNGVAHSTKIADVPQKNSTEKWVCGTCTYINKSSLSACEMCGKSKMVGPEVQPLMSGGRECPICTLVNTRESKICDACGTGLDHCPTYI